MYRYCDINLRNMSCHINYYNPLLSTLKAQFNKKTFWNRITYITQQHVRYITHLFIQCKIYYRITLTHVTRCLGFFFRRTLFSTNKFLCHFTKLIKRSEF